MLNDGDEMGSDRTLKQQLEDARQRIRELEARLYDGDECAALDNMIFDNAPGGMAIIASDGEILVCNQEAARLLGRSPDNVVGCSTQALYHNPDDRKRLQEIITNDDRITNYELPIKTGDGAEIWISVNGRSVEYKGQKTSLVSFVDITDYRRVLKQVELDEIRFEKLYTLSEMIKQPESEILNVALEAITIVSGSAIGYIYFLNEDETELVLHAWSKNVMTQCSIDAIPDSYKVADIGIWGEAIRQRKPIITNDYENCPDKRGYPEGHVPIVNHMNIPVMDDDRIVLLAGVGNKNGDYTKEDIRHISLVMNGTWRTIQRKRAEIALKAAHEQLEEKVRLRTEELETANEEMAVLNMQLVKQAQERKKARVALEESEQRFRTLFENNHSVMLLIDLETGNIVTANRAAERYYGYSVEELQGMPITNINTLSQDEIKVEMQKASDENRSFFSFRHKLASGEIRDVEVFSGPVLIDDHRNLYSIVQDVTERKQAEEALVRFERIISSTPDLVSLVDREYRYRMVNDAYLEIFRKERENILDQHVSVIVGKKFFDDVVRERLDRAFAGETFTVENWMNTMGQQRLYLATTYHPVSIDGDTIDYVSVESRDITALKESEEALQAAAQRLDMATKAGHIGIWEWDLIADDTIWDDKMYELYDVKRGEFESVYDAWRTRLHRKDLPEVERELADCIEKKIPFNSEFRIVCRDGETRNIRAAGSVMVDDDGMPLTMTGVNWDVTDQRRMEAELRRLASTDPLTGASNRRQFMDRLAEEFERCKRYKTPMVLLSLDIDHFKRINDTYGHPAGDDILKALVEQCTATLRTTDVFGRVGGEEFLAALTQASITAGKRTAERLRTLIEQNPVDTHGETIAYTISIGLTEMTPDDQDIEAILKRADDALYLAKNKGRNRVEIA